MLLLVDELLLLALLLFVLELLFDDPLLGALVVEFPPEFTPTVEFPPLVVTLFALVAVKCIFNVFTVLVHTETLSAHFSLQIKPELDGHLLEKLKLQRFSLSEPGDVFSATLAIIFHSQKAENFAQRPLAVVVNVRHDVIDERSSETRRQSHKSFLCLHRTTLCAFSAQPVQGINADACYDVNTHTSQKRKPLNK